MIPPPFLRVLADREFSLPAKAVWGYLHRFHRKAAQCSDTLKSSTTKKEETMPVQDLWIAGVMVAALAVLVVALVLPQEPAQPSAK